jgi:hypothetical protein
MIFDIPLSVYRYLLRLSVAIVVIGGFFYYNMETTNRIMKIASAWFMIVMTMNLINMDVTLGHYSKNKHKLGPKGVEGSKGPKGFKGESLTCGSICGSDPKPMEGDNIDENGNINPSNNIKIGKCVFPFVYKYTNQYAPIKACGDNLSYNEKLRCYDLDVNGNPTDPNIPRNANEGGVCATQLDIKKNPVKWGYTKNSNKIRLLREKNRELSREEAEYQKTNSGIVDIQLVKGIRSDIKCPTGYKKIERDLNEGSSGAYVYACKKIGTSNLGVGHIDIARNRDKCADITTLGLEDQSKILKYKKLPIDLNADTNITGFTPNKLFMCLGMTNRDFVTDVKFENNPDLEDPDYSMNTIDLNETTDGSPVYMYTSKTRLDFTTMDTAFVFDNFIYFIILDKFYRFNKRYRASDPYPVAEKFGKLPENINAAFVYGGDNKLYFFAGELVYQYNARLMKISDEYPKKIENVFKGVPTNIDAVFTNPNDNNTYFFRDKLVYKYNSTSKRVEEGYPRNIVTKFPGAPDNPDSVIFNNFDGKIYFLRGNQYWVLKSNETLADGYPKAIAEKFPGLGVVPDTQSYFNISNSFSGDDILLFGGRNRQYYFKLNKKSLKLSGERKISDLFKKAPEYFDCIFYNDLTRNYYLFEGIYVHIYKGSVTSMTARRKLASSIFEEFPDNIDAIFQIPDSNLVYAVKGPSFVKYLLDETLKTFKLVEAFDASDTVPFLRDGVDGIVFIENRGNSMILAGIRGIKYALFEFDKRTETFKTNMSVMDYLDSDNSPFYKKEKKGDKVTEKGLKVRQ